MMKAPLRTKSYSSYNRMPAHLEAFSGHVHYPHIHWCHQANLGSRTLASLGNTMPVHSKNAFSSASNGMSSRVTISGLPGSLSSRGVTSESNALFRPPRRVFDVLTCAACFCSVARGPLALPFLAAARVLVSRRPPPPPSPSLSSSSSLSSV